MRGFARQLVGIVTQTEKLDRDSLFPQVSQPATISPFSRSLPLF